MTEIGDLAALDHAFLPCDSGGTDTAQTMLFTALNPEGSVSVTALLGGQIFEVKLSSTVTSMVESELTDEVPVVASLARLQALAGQHAIIAGLMSRLGHDPAATRSFLERELALPSPQSVSETRAQVFSSRHHSYFND